MFGFGVCITDLPKPNGSVLMCPPYLQMAEGFPGRQSLVQCMTFGDTRWRQTYHLSLKFEHAQNYVHNRVVRGGLSAT